MESGPLKTTPSCPFCDCADVEQVGLWGGQMITAQWRCAGCGSYFEAIRESFDERAQPGEGAQPGERAQPGEGASGQLRRPAPDSNAAK